MSEQRPGVVAIVQPFVPTYRAPLFDALAAQLAEHGLTLEVWHDQPRGIVAARGNATMGSWSVPIKQHRVSIRRRNVTLRNIHRAARRVDAVVHGLASSNVETYLLAADPSVNLMLWGHGRNFTASNNALDQRLEQWLLRRASHAFVYTGEGARHVVEGGTDQAKVTVVRNSTDTGAIVKARRDTSAGAASALARELGVVGKQVGLFVGAFDKPKDLPFLFAAADLVQAVMPDFALLLAGAGPLDDYVTEMVKVRPYAHLLGRLAPEALGRLSHVADLVLMPGRVGLVAVDSLAMGVPLVTTNHDFHAPEVEYLDDTTSAWLDQDPRAYADGLVDLFADAPRRAAMSRAAAEAVSSLSVQAAAANFTRGLLSGLGRR